MSEFIQTTYYLAELVKQHHEGVETLDHQQKIQLASHLLFEMDDDYFIDLIANGFYQNKLSSFLTDQNEYYSKLLRDELCDQILTKNENLIESLFIEARHLLRDILECNQADYDYDEYYKEYSQELEETFSYKC